ncbi:MAG: glycosyltransferase [Patescibacteria group bacterium]
MNVISIGTDRKIFEEGSAVRQRMIEYGALFDQLHIIVFAQSSLGLEAWRISNNVWVYPTNSFTKLLYMRDAGGLAQTIVKQRNLTAHNTVVTAQDPFETGSVAFGLRKKFGFPMQLQVHTELFNPQFLKQSFLNKHRVKMARSILPYAQEIRVVSNKIKQSIIKELKIPEQIIDVLPIYVDKTKYMPVVSRELIQKYPQYNFIILMASRLAPEKNISFALDVFKDVVIRFPQCGLVIVGEGPEEAALKKKIAKLGISDSVVFEPWQSNLAPYYKSAQAFFQVSSFEGYGMTLVEAGLSDLPIVTSDVGIAGDVLIDNKNAMVCPVGDHSCFVQKLSALVEDPLLRDRIRKNVAQDVAASLPQSHEDYVAKYKAYLEKAFPPNA